MGAVRGTLSKQPHILTTHNNPTMKSLVLLIALAITAVAAGVHEGDFQEDTTPNSDFAHDVFEDYEDMDEDDDMEAYEDIYEYEDVPLNIPEDNDNDLDLPPMEDEVERLLMKPQIKLILFTELKK